MSPLPLPAAFALSYVTYVVTYFFRAASAAAKRPLSSALGLSPALLGRLDAGFLTAYTLASFLLPVRRWASLARLGLCAQCAHSSAQAARSPWRSMAIGLAGTAAAFALLAASEPSVLRLAVAQLASGAFQALLYPACMASLRGSATRPLSALTLAAWTTCAACGSASGGRLARSAIRAAAPGLPAAAAAFSAPLPYAVVTVAALVSADAWHGQGSAALQPAAPPPGCPRRRPAALAAVSPALALHGSLFGCAKFVRYAFALWLPFHLDALAATAHSPFPLASAAPFDSGNLVGALAGGALADWLAAPHGVAAAALAALTPALVLLPGALRAGGRHGVGCLALTGVLAGCAETLQGPVSIMRHARPGQEAGAAAFVTALGSLAALAAAPGVPALAGVLGGDWGAAFGALAGVAGAATVLSVGLLAREAAQRRRKRD